MKTGPRVLGIPSATLSALACKLGAPRLVRHDYTAHSMRGTALGKLPLLYGKSRHSEEILRKHGFVRAIHGYRHPDGSKLTFSLFDEEPRLSFNGVPLRHLPTWWK